jgi:ligand-binding sensor protein
MSALVVDRQGEPLTEVSHPCDFCQIMQSSPSGKEACRASWKLAAEHINGGGKYFTCHAGLQYVAAPVIDKNELQVYSFRGNFTGSRRTAANRASVTGAWLRITTWISKVYSKRQMPSQSSPPTANTGRRMAVFSGPRRAKHPARTHPVYRALAADR